MEIANEQKKVWHRDKARHRPMRVMWINIAMHHISAFHLTLAYASNLIAQELDRSVLETTEAMKHYNAAIRHVSNQLADPIGRTSDNVIATILGLACFDVRLLNFNTS